MGKRMVRNDGNRTMNNEQVNLEKLKSSRIKTKPGDIFVFRPKGHDYFFGMTISVEAKIGGFKDCVLIYLYNVHSKDKYQMPELNKNNLLVSPIITNYLAWSRGYFETVGYKPLSKDDLLQPNCFHCKVFNAYFNEHGDKLDKAYEPVGIYGLSGYMGIAVKISHALGIPVTPY